MMTPGYYLVALDAASGREIETFGDKGWVDLHQGLRRGPGSEDMDIGLSFGVPMTYMLEDKQDLMMAVSSRGQPASIVALVLP